jgi:hypothetical protein
VNPPEARLTALSAGRKGCNAIDIREYDTAIERFEDAIEVLEAIESTEGEQ